MKEEEQVPKFIFWFHYQHFW